MAEETPTLVEHAVQFGSGDSYIRFGMVDIDPRDGPCDFFLGPITVRTVSGEVFVLEDRNGVEAASLARARDDLRQLMNAGAGSMTFGDHDYSGIVSLAIEGGEVRLHADLAALDLWDLPIAAPTFDDLERTIGQIDLAETKFGPLVGYCGGCGMPTSMYNPSAS